MGKSCTYHGWLELHDDLLVSVSMQPLATHQESFELPELICEAVPGWCGAVVLYDPKGLAASLVRQAREWTWEPLELRCDAWVAEEITNRAETVHKLLTALGNEHRSTAAVKRFLLATRLARVLAIHHRILYESENHLWDLVAGTMGKNWREAQSAALGLSGETFGEPCIAALRMYALVAAEVERLLDDQQRRVVRHACALVERHIGEPGQSASL